MSSIKQRLYQQFARVGKAMCHANRLELLEYLAQGEHSVETLARKSGLSVANTSKHLQTLRQAGLVQARKDGLHVYYSLSGDDVLQLFFALRTVGERHLKEAQTLIDTYLESRDHLEPLPREELLARAREGLVTVIDVRPPDEYAAGHVPGAINLPLQELEKRLDELPRDREVVAYCRGPHCVLAFDAVERLREHGFRARRLQDGFPEWRSEGLATE